MKLVEKKFKLTDGDWGLGFWTHKDIELCDESIYELFPFIPNEITTIWISLHDRPSQCRYQVKLILLEEDIYSKEVDLKVIGTNFITSNESLDKILYPLLGKKVYLQVEYEE